MKARVRVKNSWGGTYWRAPPLYVLAPRLLTVKTNEKYFQQGGGEKNKLCQNFLFFLTSLFSKQTILSEPKQPGEEKY